MYPQQLLMACFGTNDESRLALEACTAFHTDEMDAPTRRLLPILYRRWSGHTGNSLIQLGQKAYLTTWVQNRERMAQLGSVLGEFEKAGIECMLLKGAALTLRHYRDYGSRNMADFDVMIHYEQIQPAIESLFQNGWVAEEGCTIEGIQRQSRVRHAWQFVREGTQNCDLHWRPLAQCYAPRVTEMFWEGAESVEIEGRMVKVPCPADQFFHVCVHAMHWEWTPNLHWVADALTVLNDAELYWDRAAELAVNAEMRMRFTQAVAVLESQFQAVVPKDLVSGTVPAWERREFLLLQKRCPLSLFDSLAWHGYHFRRLRPFDPQWRAVSGWYGFTQYLATFLDASNWRMLLRKAWEQAKIRAEERALEPPARGKHAQRFADRL